jgi:hypothetical protein
MENKHDTMPHDKQQLPIAAKDKDFMTNHSFTTLSQREPTKPAVITSLGMTSTSYL